MEKSNVTSMIDAAARGVFPISVTPFLDDGAIDFASMDRVTDFFLNIGVPGITVLGLLGEANRLSRSESLDLVQRVARRADGRAKIIVGTSQPGFDELQSFTRAALDLGAAGFMVAPASGLRTEEQLLAYFEEVGSRIGDGVPIVLQDYPQTTGVFMSVSTIGRLIERVPNIQIVKHEEGSALRKITSLRAQEAQGRRRVSVLVGNSALHLPQELARGVDGANTGVAFPEMLIEVCNRHFAGDHQACEDLYDVFLPVILHEWQVGVGLAIRKEVFRRRGLIATARTRAPGPSLDGDDHKELTCLLSRLHRRLDAAGEAGLISTYRIREAA